MPWLCCWLLRAVHSDPCMEGSWEEGMCEVVRPGSYHRQQRPAAVLAEARRASGLAAGD